MHQEKGCTICSFVNQDRQIGDNLAGVKALQSGETAPFLQTSTWLDIQCNDSTHSCLKNLIKTGQGPERKKTGGEETVLKHLHGLYMKDNLKIDKNWLVLVRAQHGFMDWFVISVSTNIFPGLCFTHHHWASHPTKFQMMKLLKCYRRGGVWPPKWYTF